MLDRHPGHIGCRLGLAYCLSRRPLLALRLRSPRHLVESLEVEEMDPDLLPAPSPSCCACRPRCSRILCCSPVLRQTVPPDLDLESEASAFVPVGNTQDMDAVIDIDETSVCW